ncbi:EF-hand domain-containing protein [Kordiimonas laminariae]|uniref:EF-hand domain-containing protein n=1 Tax=Kordiimonas laminariae TaxID=2917717 RepID=UPI001FF1E174|nr:hypothetical protein [Kordiimonas laminariae]MCK0068614.1 hypothetical protein [Kordiimonas laminariae]
MKDLRSFLATHQNRFGNKGILFLRRITERANNNVNQIKGFKMPRSVTLPVIISTALVITACSGKNERPDKQQHTRNIESRYQEFIQRWDLDTDGLVTCKDTVKKNKALFTQLDLDKNLVVTRREFGEIMFHDKSYRFIPFEQIDNNADGVISEAEFANTPNHIFTRFDKDGNCNVSKQEFAIAAKEIASERRRSKGQGRRPGGKGGGRGKPQGTF